MKNATSEKFSTFAKQYLHTGARRSLKYFFVAAWLGFLAEVHWFSEHSKIFDLDKRNQAIFCVSVCQKV